MSSRDTKSAILMREGMAELTRGNQNNALKLFEQVIRNEPKFAEAYNKVSAIHASKNEHRHCITFSTLALMRQPRHYGAMNGQGLAFAAIAGTNAFDRYVLLIDQLIRINFFFAS